MKQPIPGQLKRQKENIYVGEIYLYVFRETLVGFGVIKEWSWYKWNPWRD